MNEGGENLIRQLDAAVTAWNAKIGGAYSELSESLRTTKRKLELVQRVLNARRNLDRSQILQRIKARAGNNEDANLLELQTAVTRIDILDQTLTSYHVELRTLHAQAGRAVAAGDVLTEELLTLQDPPDVAALTLQGELPGLEAGADSPEDRDPQMATLIRMENERLREQLQRLQVEVQRLRGQHSFIELRDTEMDALRAELAHVREQLRIAQAQPGAAEVPAELVVQQTVKEAELDALRKELGHVREELQLARLRAEQAQQSVGDREAKLTGRVESLRRELLRVKEQLEHTEQRAMQTVLSAERQQELAEARKQVDAIHMEGLDAMRLPGEDAAAQFERICRFAFDTQGNRRPMGKILLDAGVVSTEQLEAALREQQTAWNRHLGNILVELGFTTEGIIAQTLAAQIRIPYVHLLQEVVEPEAIAMISGSLAHHHSCIPLRVQEERLVVAMTNPFDLVALEDLQLAAGRGIEAVVAPADEVRRALRRYYPQFVRV